jgi:hypothetical protein
VVGTSDDRVEQNLPKADFDAKVRTLMAITLNDAGRRFCFCTATKVAQHGAFLHLHSGTLVRTHVPST